MKFDVKQATAEAMARFDAQFPTGPIGATGPTSETGKQRSRLNAYKHGLTGQIHLFTPEEHTAFEKHCQSIVEALAPVGILEHDLAQSIAEDKWRLNRARAIEHGIFALGQMADESQPDSLQNDPREIDQPEISQALSQAKTWIEDGKHIQLLALYQQRIQRSIERNIAELRTLRAERLAARQQAVEEAILLSQLAKSKGETYNPAADFPSPEFVFSIAEFELLIGRQQRLDEARALPKTRQNAIPPAKCPPPHEKENETAMEMPNLANSSKNSAWPPPLR
jgi:hypothetical protein